VVIARRDLLGLRRAPWAALYGLGLGAAGSAGLMLSLQSPQTPTVAPLVSLIVAYLGFGAWCEGLRLHADNAGTSRLLGIPYRDTALAHLTAPMSCWALSVLLVSSGLSLAGLVRPSAFVWALGVGALLAGANLMSSFRAAAARRCLWAKCRGAGDDLLVLQATFGNPRGRDDDDGVGCSHRHPLGRVLLAFGPHNRGDRLGTCAGRQTGPAQLIYAHRIVELENDRI